MNRISLLTAALILTLTGCSEKENPEDQKQEKFCIDEKFKNKIQIVPVAEEPVVEGYQLNGRIESNPNKVVSFNSLLSGIVTNVHFNLGDKVTKGQVLAELQSTELTGYQSEISNTNAQIKLAQEKLKAVKSLFDDGIASQKELVEAQSELSVLQSELRKNQSNMSMYSGSATRGTFQIKAPETGYITSKEINPGMQISPDSGPLFTVSDLNDVWVMANIYASNIQNIYSGMEVQIRTISYPDQVFQGKITTIAHVLDNETKVLKARISLQNPDYRLKPGMIADITALRHSGGNMICIPVAAIVFADNQDHVLVYKDDCNIEIRKVKIAYKNNDQVYLSEGLKAGEQIITKNQLLLYNRITGQ
ncbi:MAG: efflux transporter periplasmic adaptor subunit [Bacteroidetes bacterium 43-16]|nr:MAG: efflux transporter periplasmic adaptor subunit [Bacteroidetes bacterium 43-16]